jgi:hypothetical protein
LEEANARANQAAADLITAQTTGGTSKVEVTVVAPPFTDPNSVAEAVVEIIRNASNRGTVDVAGFE